MGFHNSVPESQFDRFIPNRSATNFDLARTVLTGRKSKIESISPCPPSKAAYRKLLADTFNMNNPKILAFNNSKLDPPLTRLIEEDLSPVRKPKSVRTMSKIPKSAASVWDAPGIGDDFYSQLIDWSIDNVIAIALGNTVYLLNLYCNSVTKLADFEEEVGPVKSVSWAPYGKYVAIGLKRSLVQLCDAESCRLVRTLREGNRKRVCSLDWNHHILTSGGSDHLIVNSDSRMKSDIVATYRGHKEKVLMPQINGFTVLKTIRLQSEHWSGALSKVIFVDLE
ncbi:OLC1v1031028C1 [Oldenlandia corymbosa var. corymbosa]|uniref:OLC1v1031028C1 n=1 Tax=Oldenlandia corymbosa var. corymbosa TaxID=529605 RepID=A0AAV1CHG4_OLDCO|nr:OLC1v1031028C1 [Oldenlandia corymbosa var. corymbosa]